MIALVERHLDAIRALCEEIGVLRLALAGSAGTGDFDPERSDVDVLVDYPTGYECDLRLTRYFDFSDCLAMMLGRRIDLVMAGAMRKSRFIRSVNQSRRLLFAA